MSTRLNELKIDGEYPLFKIREYITLHMFNNNISFINSGKGDQGFIMMEKVLGFECYYSFGKIRLNRVKITEEIKNGFEKEIALLILQK